LRRFPQSRVYAFEPNPVYQEELNSFSDSDKRFSPQFLALSDCKGSFELNITSSRGSTSLLTPSQHLKQLDPEGSVIEKTETVEVVTIDEWIEDNNIPSIELFKFDIQGNELKALIGAHQTLQKSVVLIYTEVCFNPLYNEGAIFSQIDVFLREYGFEVYDLYGPKYGPDGGLLWSNAIFIHRQRANIRSV
jgi:FkbM family methyltransferase